MNIRVRWFFTAACLSLIMMLVLSCGRKTPPLTPDSPRPEAVKELKAAVRDNIAFLSWHVPARNVEGKEMRPSDILGFQVYRAEIERDRKRLRYKPAVEIYITNPAPAEVRNGVVYWNDKNLKYGQAYGYKVRALGAKGGVSQFSDEARVVPLLSLASPKNLTASAGDSLIMLSWDPVNTKADGSIYNGFVGYNVYRGADSNRYEETPLNKEPARTNSFKDISVLNDKTYFYMVRAVDSPAVPWKESLNSTEASATPKDMTSPEKPEGLTVVPGVGRIFLTWNENKERDLAGYHVYRSLRSGKDYVRLTDKPINRSTFSDETAKAGIAYYYIVTAVDQTGNEGQPSKEQKAYAEKLR